MSEQSSFIILRHDKDNLVKCTDNEIQDAYNYEGWHIAKNEKEAEEQSNFFDRLYLEKDIPIYVQLNKTEYIDHFTKDKLDKIMEVTFNSSFRELKEYYNLSSYSNRHIEVISLSEAEEILEAVNYLLYEKYDKDYESYILENKYIKILGETYTPYFNFWHPSKDSDDDFYYSEYEEEKIVFKQIKIILDAFVLMSIEDSWNNLEYKLIYCV